MFGDLLRKHSVLLSVLLLSLSLAVSQSATAATVYVDLNAAAAGDGSSWTLAFQTIQEGIDAAAAMDEVWVADGTYLEVITLATDVSVYGGFEGVGGLEETMLSQRDWETNVTVIDGSTADGGLPADHVVVVDGVVGSRFDGFTVTGGFANGTGSHGNGGGVFCESSDSTNLLTNLIVERNDASPGYDGVYFGSGCAIQFTSSVVRDNYQFGFGFGGGTPTIEDCRIYGHSAGGLGGSGTPAIRDTWIVGNRSGISGSSIGGTIERSVIAAGIESGIFRPGAGFQLINSIVAGFGSWGIRADLRHVQVTNSTIAENGADGIWNPSSSSQIVNTIVAGNGQLGLNESTGSSDATLDHVLFHDNSSGDYRDEGLATYTGATDIDMAVPEVTNSLDGDPLFSHGSMGTWDADPIHDSSANRTTLTDSTATWIVGEHEGKLVNPNTTHFYQFYVVANTATTLTVVGNPSFFVSNGDTYQFKDYHLLNGSPAIDPGRALGAPANDIDGHDRPLDVSATGDDGTGEEFDVGADEHSCYAVPICEAITGVAAEICGAATVTFTAEAIGSGLTYAWDLDDDGQFDDDTGMQTTTALGIGDHTVAVRVTDDCMPSPPTCTMSFDVTVHPVPTATVSGGGLILPGETADIEAALTGTAPWDLSWSDGVDQLAVGTSPADRTIAPASTTVYSVTSLADANCPGTSSGSATVTVDGDVPTDPVVTTPGHVAETWSNDDTIEASWSGAMDTGGAGLAGYSIGFDSTAPTYQGVELLGTSGTSEGDFDDPSAIAVGPGGEIYIADSANHRIQKFGADGSFERSWGWGVASGASAFEVCSSSCQAGTADTGNGAFDGPSGLTVDTTGNVWVADSNNDRVQEFMPDGTFVSTFGSTGSTDGLFDLPSDLVLDGLGNIYVVDTNNNRVQKLLTNGTFVDAWGTLGVGDGEFTQPMTVDLDGSGNVLVTDGARVQQFTPAGAFLSSWGTSGTAAGELDDVSDVFVDGAGKVWITDRGTTHRIQRFSASGVFELLIGGPGAGLGQLQGPSGLTMTDGDLWVSEADNDRLQRFELASVVDATVDVAHVADPHGSTSTPRTDGSDHWFHLRTCDTLANCTSTVHAGPFWIDGTPPGSPSAVMSSSHAVGTATSDATIDVSWTAATDATSGVAAYSWSFQAGSSPSCDQVDAGASTSTTSVALADGSWYLHVCAVDNAGNWGPAVATGPYVVDTSPPTNASSLISTSHITSSWSTDPTIDVQWSGANDAGGLSGYSWIFDESAITTPDQVIDTAHTSDPHQATSATFADSSGVTFHLRSCDNAGNCSTTAHLGPFPIDSTAPGSPSALVSSSHTVASPSNDATIDVSWTAAADALSGVAGYGWSFQAGAPPSCDQVDDGAATSATSALLAAGSWYLHVCAVDAAGNWGPAVSVGPFVIDTSPPNNASSLISTSHTVSSWSTDPTIDIEWSGASDAGGLSGYSWLFDESAMTTPDQVVDTAHSSDPHQVTSAMLADSAGVTFHLRSCDDAGNCSTAAHLGPFQIDATAPEVPTGLGSSSHPVDTPTNDDTIDVNWTAATDALSGVAGYGWSFEHSSTPSCDQVEDGAATSATSAPLVDGSWYLHVCAVDSAGNWGPAVAAGPFVVDTMPPANASSLISTSHTVSNWSTDPTIDVEWAGASDAGGLSGYSWLFDEHEMTSPDTSVETSHGSDPHQIASHSLTDSAGVTFHLRSCDLAGLCSPTVHLGPFPIDSTPPTAPTDLSSSSHSVGIPTNDDTIDVSWTASTDALSGVAGYGWTFETGSAPSCEQVDDGNTTAATSDPLADGSWYLHVCAVDTAGNWSSAESEGPFVIDTTAPANPVSVSSTSHTESTWSNVESIEVEWSGASDASDLAGYSVEFDQNAMTIPDTVVDVVQTSDPHSASSSPVADGDDHYFHLRTCDVSETCADGIHLGPFWVDTVDPSAPSALESTSHETSVVSSDPTIDLTWEAAVDDRSGTAGYAVRVESAEGSACDQALDTTDLAFTTDPLADGEWFVHVCAVDEAGNWGLEVTAGPYVIDSEAPRVVETSAVAGGFFSEGALMTDPITGFAIRFSEGMFDPVGDSDEDDVTSPDNYRVLEAGADGTWETVDCASGTAPTDGELLIDEVFYEPSDQTAWLDLDGDTSLADGLYRVVACGTTSLFDTAGNALDGNNDGVAGDDFVRHFRIVGTDELANPNLGGDTFSWDYDGPTSGALFWQAEDAEDAPISGSAQLHGTMAPGDLPRLLQCVTVPSGRASVARARVRVESAVSGSPAVTVSVEEFDSGDCTGSATNSQVGPMVVFGDTGGAWVEIDALRWRTGATTNSVRYSILVEPGDAIDLDVSADVLVLGSRGALFSDGFETGDTDAWTVTNGGF